MTGTRPMVLVVDDVADIRHLAAIFLEEAGYQVAFASDGVEALKYLRGHPAPALILLDLGMPVMDGWEFLWRQRRLPALASIPVALYSTDFDRSTRCYARNVVATIAKTTPRQEFVGIIDGIVRH